MSFKPKEITRNLYNNITKILQSNKVARETIIKKKSRKPATENVMQIYIAYSCYPNCVEKIIQTSCLDLQSIILL